MIRTLAEEDLKEAARVLAAAFQDYPVMRYVVPPGEPDRENQLKRLCGFFTAVRLARNEPAIGAFDQSGLVGVALVSDPAGGPSPPPVADMRRALWAELGDGSRDRYQRYGDASAPLLPESPRLHLNLIGVLERARGTGVGRSLIAEVHRLAEVHPTAEGVSLTTEDPGNLPLYHHLGYRELGSDEISPELRTWALYRPNDGVAV